MVELAVSTTATAVRVAKIKPANKTISYFGSKWKLEIGNWKNGKLGKWK
jgi:hypothetical protein